MFKKLLIIDNVNLFLRSYIVDPTISKNGIPIGGLQGTLKSLQRFVREIKPEKIIVAWDGAGGSLKRKQIKKDYKDGRRPPKMNWTSELSSEELSENKSWQMSRLFEYYEDMPLYQFILDNVEADDVISFIASHERFKDYKKVILSADKDFIQLLNKDTILYRPAQNEVLNVNRVIEKYEIHPNNFLLARSISGDDKSDNTENIKNVGMKSIANRFPFLKEEKSYTLDDVLNVCKEQKKKLKIHESIILHEEKIRQNYSIMQLAVAQMSYNDKHKIEYELDNKILQFRKTEIIKKMLEDGIGGWDFSTLYAGLNYIISALEEEK